MICVWCAVESVSKNGRDRRGAQVYRCQTCRHCFTPRTRTPFTGYQFPTDVIALAVKWYLRSRLSYAGTSKLLAERGICVDPSTISLWVLTAAYNWPRGAEVVQPAGAPHHA